VWLRKRGPFLHLVHGDDRARQAFLTWKKNSNQGAREEPPDLVPFIRFLEEFGGPMFDLVTVPPPSFHDYAANGGHYPAEILARRVAEAIGKTLSVLWPERYQKKGKVWHANISKIYPEPAEPVAGRLVLVLDDIATTGNTLTAACDTVARAGGYPAGVAIG
jgi:hypothetical protein